MYCLKSIVGDNYVDRLTFSDTGINVTFTPRLNLAAKVEHYETADQLNNLCIGMCKIIEWKGTKPTAEDYGLLPARPVQHATTVEAKAE